VPKFQLVLLIHAHQPVGNFDDVFERSYASSYLPFMEVLERHPAIHVGLHYSGPLLEWIERAHPEYFERLRRAGEKRAQSEMVGGGFYEPVLIAIPPQDRHRANQAPCRLYREAFQRAAFAARGLRKARLGAADTVVAGAGGRGIHAA
jgi:alpha-amylase/alpha-mannosidase (GH57 family)